MADGAEQKEARQRSRSTIQFPYGDLNDAINVAETIYRRAGSSCRLEQLAPWMGHDSMDSGAFRLKIATARIFDLIEAGRNEVSLTKLGQQIVDPSQEAAARVWSFMRVPLYSEIYERYRGRLLPPDSGLENEMANLGVTRKQTKKARQAFQRSAEQAGLFSEGKDRLVIPAGVTLEPGDVVVTVPTAKVVLRGNQPPSTGTISRSLSGAVDQISSELHPFVLGLLQTLPETGSVWTDEDRQDWLDAAKQIFGLLYKKTPGKSKPQSPSQGVHITEETTQ